MNLNKFTIELGKVNERANINLGHVALNDLKTLDRLLKDAKAAENQMKKSGKKNTVLEDKEYEAANKVDLATTRIKDEEKNLDNAKKEAAKRIAAAEKIKDDAFLDLMNAKEDFENMRKKQNKIFADYKTANNAWGQDMKAAENIADRLDQSIKNFLAAAKALGLDVKSEVGKYQAAAQSIFQYNAKNFTNRDI